ncbi:hypothetical protein PRIPAC_77431, partial [Pristionchus pacificus]
KAFYTKDETRSSPSVHCSTWSIILSWQLLLCTEEYMGISFFCRAKRRDSDEWRRGYSDDGQDETTEAVLLLSHSVHVEKIVDKNPPSFPHSLYSP